MPNHVLEGRVRAAWRARACAAGLSTGAMIFCVGAGIAVPVSLNAAALSAPPALLLAALIACRAQRVLRRTHAREDAFSRGVYAILAVTLALGAAFLVAAQVNLAERTLLMRAHVGFICALTLGAVLLCALCGAEAAERFCFAVRYALPALLLSLGAKALQRGTPVGFFPVLGAGALPLAGSSLCMLCAALPALLILCPSRAMEGGGAALVPRARFFVLRVLAGGVVGTLLLLSLTMCNTYDTLMSLLVWGERMMVTCTHEPRLGVLQMLLILTQMLGLGLAGVSLLAGAERAAAKAMRREGRAPLAACFLLAAAALLAMKQAGFARSLYAVSLLAVPMLTALALAGFLRTGERVKKRG